MFITILAFIIVLGIIVMVHELGHFFTARIFKVKVEEFGLGFPPRLAGFYKGKSGKRKWLWGSKFKSEEAPNTIYSLNKIPIGGFVKIKGEDGGGGGDDDSFVNKPAWQRSIILSAGVAGNILLCIMLLAIGYSVGLPTVVEDEVLRNVKSVSDTKIQVVSINSASPAETAGFQIGDAILSLDSSEVETIAEINDFTEKKDNLLMNVKIKRGGEILSLEVIPRVLETSNNKAVMGVGLVKTAIVSYKWYEAIWQGLLNTFYILGAIVEALWLLIKNIFTTGEVSTELAGPVGIAVLTGQVVKLGWIYVLQFAALLSLNLGIINILPFPALDGGRLLFILIERIRGKEINKRVENIVHTIGFAILMVAIVFVTYRDIVRWGGQIVSRLSS